MREKELAYKSATELLELYRTKKVSPVEVTKSILDRIDRYNELFKAYRMVDHEGALEKARASEERWMKGEPVGLLDGIPTSIKDCHPVKGWNCLYGSLLRSPSYIEPEDFPYVARLREHGAVFLGMTNMCEEGWKFVGDSPVHGISRNPWNTDLTPGGSSAGAAIAAAAGLGAINMGGDGGGSIRFPASLCGVVGLKATYGRVPRPLESLLAIAHQGPLTRTVADTALAMNVVSRPDPHALAALEYDGRDYLAGLDQGVRGLRIAYCDEFGSKVPLDEEIARKVRDVAYMLAQQGAIVEEANPGLGETFETYKVLNSAYQVHKIRGKSPEEVALKDPVLVANARFGETLSSEDLLEAGYERARWIAKMTYFFRSYDLLITPTVPVVAYEVGRNNPAHIAEMFSEQEQIYNLVNYYQYPFNYTHNPAISVPCGLNKDGLPIGLQIIGAFGDDYRVLVAARAMEMLNPFPELPQI